MRRRQQSGFTYLMVLFAVAFMGVVLAAAGETWQSVRQREREVELLFVGNAFRQAIGGYYEGTPGPAKRFPRSLEELLKDPRYLATRRYLRKIYVDPVTGKSEWGLVKGPDGGIIGVQPFGRGADQTRELSRGAGGVRRGETVRGLEIRLRPGQWCGGAWCASRDLGPLHGTLACRALPRHPDPRLRRARRDDAVRTSSAPLAATDAVIEEERTPAPLSPPQTP